MCDELRYLCLIIEQVEDKMKQMDGSNNTVT